MNHATPLEPRPREPRYSRRVFGYFLALSALGVGWSATHAPRAMSPEARAAATREVYAGCQASVRRHAVARDRLRFPAEPESVSEEGADTLLLASSVTVEPPLGSPYVQSFTCRATRGRGEPARWTVTRTAMDLPVS